MNASSSLEPFVTIHQAMAWVQFRTIEAVEIARKLDGYSALRIYHGEPPKNSERTPPRGSVNDLRRSLCEARLIARGQLRDGQWRDIAKEDWFSLPVAPTILERQHPYVQIIVERDALLTVFPPDRISTLKGRPPIHNSDWVREAACREEPMSRHKLAEVLKSLYEEEIRRPISLSTLKRYLKKLGY